MNQKIKYNSHDREWDHCDQCIFFISCLRKERAKGKGCEAYSTFPYKETLKDTPVADLKISLSIDAKMKEVKRMGKQIEIICHSCKGLGYVTEYKHPKGEEVKTVCPECNGEGFVHDELWE